MFFYKSRLHTTHYIHSFFSYDCNTIPNTATSFTPHLTRLLTFILNAYQLKMDQKPPRPNARHILARVGFEFSGDYKLGSGRYSKVYKGYYKDADRNFAIKVIDMKKISTEFRQKFLPREISIWQMLDHKGHVYLYKDFEKADYQFSIMELGNGDMLTYVQKNGPVEENQCRGWMLQLIDALAYIHRKGIAHRDLKLENVLLFDGGVLKIADYGFCKQSQDMAATFCGSKSYSAPEILSGIRYNTFKADIWSLGVIAYIMLTNTMPFREDVDNTLIVDAQRHRRYRYSSKLGLGHECKTSIDKMMTFQADQRPSIFECSRLPWFSITTTTNTNAAIGATAAPQIPSRWRRSGSNNGSACG